jgi:hypothetical protein
MTDWIEHTTDTCPVDPETVVEVRYGSGLVESHRANEFPWWMLSKAGITHYRIITPAKPPEPEMAKTHEDYTGPTFGVPPKPEPDWIEHTADTCPVDPDTVVEVRLRGGYVRPADKAGDMDWGSFWVASFRPPLGSPIQHPLDVTHYRIITPAKPPEPEMVKSDWIKFTMSDGRPARYRVTAIGPNGAVPPTDDAPEVTFKCPLLEDPEPEMTEPDLITLRLECLKIAVHIAQKLDVTEMVVADRLLHYVLNGSVDKA